MRPVNLVEAVVALAIGAGGGTGFLFGTGDMKSGAQVEELRRTVDATGKSIDATRTELRALEEQKVAAEEKVREAADVKKRQELAAQAKAVADAAAAEARLNAAPKLPAFGQLVIKAASDVEVEHSGGKERGKSVDVNFDEKPAKFKIKGGKFTVSVTPKLSGAKLSIDVSVSPMAIIQVDGEGQGVSSAMGIVVSKTTRLDLKSPAAGELNLVLQYRK